MQCPYCNEEMKNGYIQSARPIFWGEKKHKLFFTPKGDTEFSVSKGVLNGSSCEAYYCNRCGKIIINVL